MISYDVKFLQNRSRENSQEPVAGGGVLPPSGKLYETHFFCCSFWRRFRSWVFIRPFGGLFQDIGGSSLLGRVLCIALYFKFISKSIFETILSIKFMYSVLLVAILTISDYWGGEGLAKFPTCYHFHFTHSGKNQSCYITVYL